MTCDKTMHSVAIDVASDNAGALVTTTVDGAAGNKVSFTNLMQLTLRRSIPKRDSDCTRCSEGRDWEANDAFSFLLEPLTMGAPLPGDTIVTVGADMVDALTGHAPDFVRGDITYNQVRSTKVSCDRKKRWVYYRWR